MCGVFGVISANPIAPGMLERAQAIQMHRGPDAQNLQRLLVGRWHVGLAHQRLAIIDLSPTAGQPMLSPSERSLIVYNGEVYNYLELRSELVGRGVVFRTHTDTEVIAAAIEHYGIAEALSMMNGMWAFAWVDLTSARIVIARDRFGVKPMYFCEQNGAFAFASEIKTLVRALNLRCCVNTRAVATYLRTLLQDTSDETFFEGIVKLAPGHYAEIGGAGEAPRPRITRYWSLTATTAAVTDERQAVAELQSLLDDAIRLRLRSDVPLGLLLSGGLDSSAIAAVASNRLGSGGDLTLISAVSDDPATDESAFSRAVARHLDRPVKEVRLEFAQQELLPLIGKVTEQCDEPLGGFSCVAQNLLMQKAKELGATVLLSGQGADEVFCGYRKYAAFQLQALARSGHWLEAARLFTDFIRRRTLLSRFKLGEARRYFPRWLAPPLQDIGGPALADAPLLYASLGPREDVRDRQRADIEHLSIPILTHWEDRNSMAWSREVRNPFLDYRVVSFGVNLPMNLKLHDGWTKYVLRRAVADQLPESIAWRRDKRGFTTPEARILRQVRAGAAELLGPNSEMVRRGLVDPAAVHSRFTAFFNQSVDAATSSVSSRDIFQLLSLELWLRGYREHLTG